MREAMMTLTTSPPCGWHRAMRLINGQCALVLF
jgi:hypothetical protein